MVPLDSASSWKTWKFSNRDWQIEAWRLYDIVPEHRFLANWIGDSVSQARLFVTEVGETGEETGEVADPRIARLAAVPLGGGAQRDDNLRLAGVDLRSEEHTSELQSRPHLVCRLLLEKKKKKHQTDQITMTIVLQK